jgi:RNA polymerase sigma-70 factor, ECF subfamily
VLNRAVAVAQLDGPAAALADLERITSADRPANYYLWPAVVGELARRIGDWSKAREQLTLAKELATAPAERDLIQRRLRACESAISHARIP